MLQGAVLGPAFYYLHINYSEGGIERSHRLPVEPHWITLHIKRDNTIKKGFNLLKRLG